MCYCGAWTQAAARRFRQQFEARYGPEGPAFLELPLTEVLDVAATEHKMVMVYLHSELHQDVDTFCRWGVARPAPPPPPPATGSRCDVM